MGMEKEVRKLEMDNLRAKKTDDGVNLSGYITKFDDRAEIFGFYETINKKAFDNTLKEDRNILALFDHDTSKILGSTRSGSLKLSTDKTGLKFDLKPNTNLSYTQDVVELVRSGDLAGCSFGFTVNDDEWTTKNGKDYREILDVSLFEVTLTGFPAYESSEVSCRSHEKYREEVKRFNKEKEKLKLQLSLLDMG